MREKLYACEPVFLTGYLDDRENASDDDKQRAQSLFSTKIPTGEEAIDQIYTVEGNKAIISIQGPLSMAGPDIFDLYFGYGGVSYPAIIGAFKRAAADASISEVEIHANTPGGEVSGVDRTYQALVSLSKKKLVTTLVNEMLASAGYYLLCPSEYIKATSPTDEIGSIGVVVAQWDFSKAYADMGIKKHVLVSRNAPKKAANLSTEAGRDVIQERIDAVERIFYSRISESRGISAEDIALKYGQGSVLVASDPDPKKPDALRAGMIDALVTASGDYVELSKPDPNAATAAEDKNSPPAVAGESQSQEGHKIMNLTEFLAQGPTAQAEIDKFKADAIAPYKTRNDRCAAILGSEVYAGDSSVRAKAVACLKGETTLEELNGAVGMFDMMAEKSKKTAGEAETATQGESPAQGGPAAEAIAKKAEEDAWIAAVGGKKEGK